MLSVVLIVLAVLGAWALAAVAFALITGGVIHERDHRDAPKRAAPRPVVRLGAVGPRR